MPAARDGDIAGIRINAVLNELGDRLQGIGPLQRDDIDRIPVVTNPKSPG
jgi:hypothetical protein